jgi:hypothetical protein
MRVRNRPERAYGNRRNPQASEDTTDALYGACRGALREGGVLVAVTTQARRGGRLLDHTARTVASCERVGFSYLGHVIAIHGAVEDSSLVASRWRSRTDRSRGAPPHRLVHQDVACFANDRAFVHACEEVLRRGK